MKTTLRIVNSGKALIVSAACLAMSLGNAASAQNDQRYNDDRYYRPQQQSNYDRPNANYRDSQYSLPAGTVIPVRLNQHLGSRDNSSGDSFTATVISGPDDAGLPSGTRLEGVVRESVRSGEGLPGSIDLDIRRIAFPGGGSQPISASLYSLSGKGLTRTDGRLVATSSKSNDRLKFVAIGAGAGLLLGTLTKQNSLLSTLLGAGAGYLFSEGNSKPKPGDVDLKEGQEFGVKLDRALVFQPENRRYYRRYNGNDVDYRGSQAEANLDHVRVFVNDQRVRFNADERPFINNGTVYVPLAAMSRAANFDYNFDDDMQAIFARNDQVRLRMGSRTATVNGQRHTLPAAAIRRNNVIFVPLQFVAWAARGSVVYDEAAGSVRFSY